MPCFAVSGGPIVVAIAPGDFRSAAYDPTFVHGPRSTVADSIVRGIWDVGYRPCA